MEIDDYTDESDRYSQTTDITLRRLCDILSISYIEVIFAYARLQKSYKCLYGPAMANGVWPRLFRAWADVADDDTRNSAYALLMIPMMKAELEGDEFREDDQKRRALTDLIDLAKKKAGVVYGKFRSFAKAGLKELEKTRSPESVFNLGDLQTESAADECIIRLDALANVYVEGKGLIDVTNLLYDGWRSLDFWKGQPVNTKLEKGSISFAGWVSDKKSERLDDIANYVLELRSALETFEGERKYFLDMLRRAKVDPSLDLPRIVEGTVHQLKYGYSAVIKCEALLLGKLDTSATACEEWATYHAGSDYYATLRGTSDDLVMWLETTDHAYDTVALTVTLVAAAAGGPVGLAVAAAVMGAGGLLKKKVLNQLAVRHQAQREGILTLENIIGSSIKGRIKDKARGTGKKVSKVYSLFLDPSMKTTEEVLSNLVHTAAASGVLEPLHGVGSVLGQMSKVLDTVIFATKDTTFSSQRRHAQASQAAVFASMTRDLAQFKRFHRRVGERFGAKLITIGDDDGGQQVTDEDYAKHYFGWLAEKWYDLGYSEPRNLGIDMRPFESIFPPRMELFRFTQRVAEGRYRFEGKLEIYYTNSPCPIMCKAEFTVTSEGEIRDLVLSQLDEVWGDTLWSSGLSGTVAGDVLVKIMYMPPWQRYALAHYDKEYCEDRMLVIGADEGILIVGSDNYSQPIGKLLKSINDLPSGFPVTLYNLLAEQW